MKLRFRSWIATSTALVITVSSLLILATTGAGAVAATRGPVRIEVLSNRPDLVSGGEALVRVDLPAGSSARSLKVTVGRRDVTRDFSLRQRGSATGLVEGLVNGRNLLTARLADGRGARLILTNHPRGGPVFSGPQIQPWVCTTAANGLGNPVDAQCDAPTKASYLYQPTGASSGNYKTYDPRNPPTDVATTTDQGKRVPYIIRVEEGTLDRSIYKTYVLANPAKPWTPIAPQSTWNRKLLIAFSGGCGTPHQQMPPTQPNVTYGDTVDNGELVQPDLLSRGWMTAATGLNTLNQNCNLTVSAEALMMLKEHIIDTYGLISRTIGVGGSGGSVQQFYIASAYPGLLNGIVTTASFPDLEHMTWDTSDCYLAQHYFTLTAPLTWLNLGQQLAVSGKSGPLACTEFIATFADWFDPQNRGPFNLGLLSLRPGCGLPASQTYNPTSNPRGARCSVQDYQDAIWGHSGRSNAAPLPFDNVGVEYGLDALQRGMISPQQFIDLNARIGGIDNEGNFTSARAAMRNSTAATMYRADQIIDFRPLADVPILDLRQPLLAAAPDSLSDMHQPYNTGVERARLVAANGTSRNMISWSVLPGNMAIQGVLAVDRWLQAISNDHSRTQLARKIIRDKPATIVNTCWINNSPVTNQATCARQYPATPNGGDARLAAGGPSTDNMAKCQLKPLRRADFKVAFTNAEWAQLVGIFRSGVCDWARPSVGYQRAITWATYARGPGGASLGPIPQSKPFG